MTRGLPLIAAAALFTGPAARADEKAAAAVDRAIRLIGGEEKLADLKAGIWKTSGQVQGKPSRAEFHGELPGKFRIDSTRVVDGKPVRFSRVVNGEEGWVVLGDKAVPMTPAEVEAVRVSFYHKQAVTTLLPLKHPDCKLTAAAATVNGKPATMVRAARKGYPELTLYFDAATGLPVKSEMTDGDRAAAEGGRRARGVQGVRRDQNGGPDEDVPRREAVPGSRTDRVHRGEGSPGGHVRQAVGGGRSAVNRDAQQNQ